MNPLTSGLSKPSPTDFCIEPGLLLKAGATVFRIQQIQDGVANLENVATLDRKAISMTQLLSEISNQNVRVAEEGDSVRALEGDLFLQDSASRIATLPIQDLSPAQKEHVIRVSRYIYGLRAKGHKSLNPKQPFIQLELDKLQKVYNDPEQPKASWVYKWSLRLDRANGDERALIPNYNLRGGRGSARLDPVIEDAIQRAIQPLKDHSASPIRTHQVLETAQNILGIEQPTNPELYYGLSWTTVDRRLKEVFGAYEICVRNHGKAFANKLYYEWFPRDRAAFPMEVFETDDTDTGVFLIDERSGLPFGRCHLTGVIDQFSGVVPGIEISEQPRSKFSAISALINAILPTDMKSIEFAKCEGGFEFYGKPAIVLFDNAIYNHAEEVETHSKICGFIPAWAKPYTPQEKALIEGWNGLLKQDFLSTLPGYRGDKRYKEGLKEGMNSANVGALDFVQNLNKWIADKYSNTPRGEDQISPRQRWIEAMEYSKSRLPREIGGLRLEATLHHTLRLRPEGINFLGIIYSSPFTQALRKRYGHNYKITFRFSPKDMGTVYVKDPALKTYMPVPTALPEFACGLTFWQLKLVRKIARANGKRNPLLSDLLLARESLRVMTEQLRFSPKISERKRAIRTGNVPKSSVTKETSTKKKEESISVTELEYQVMELESVEMDDSDEGWSLPNDAW